jgi:alpha/beta superfamily hydrolase
LSLFVHGITSNRSELGIFDSLAQRLAGVGVASLRFDYRGHGQSLMPACEISLYGIFSDIEAAWLRLRTAVPDDRHIPLFVIGSSFGGGLAYRWANGVADAARAFLFAPVVDYFADIERTAPRWKQQLALAGVASYGGLELSRGVINEAQNFVSMNAGSRLHATIFHGTADHDVPFESSLMLAKRFPFIELVPLEGADHLMCCPGDFYMRTESSGEYRDAVIEQVCREIYSLLPESQVA